MPQNNRLPVITGPCTTVMLRRRLATSGPGSALPSLAATSEEVSASFNRMTASIRTLPEVVET